MIRVKNLKIPKSSKVSEDAEIHCESFEIGENCYIGKGVSITCRHFKAGNYLYMADRVEVGRGGCKGLRSTVTIGDHVGIFEDTIINPSEPVRIGDNVGIGAEVMIWTHGAWLDVFEGFPSGFGPIEIGDNVWLPARSIVLPKVKIGSNSVITINSIVNRDIPSGSLAGGNPARVIKENVYPRKLTEKQKKDLILEIMSSWNELLLCKIENSSQKISFFFDSKSTTLTVSYKDSVCDIFLKEKPYGLQILHTSGKDLEADAVFEDLRDYLRRRGLKIYNGKPFKSIEPKYLDF